MRYGTRNMGLGIVHPQKGGLVKQVNINPQLQYRYKQVMKLLNNVATVQESDHFYSRLL
jgi:hypothetical protein